MFDYVIVGGGSAGCVVAARLAEDPDKKVLLLEAGPDAGDVDDVRVPAMYNRLFRSQYDWNCVTRGQDHADDRQVHWPRGKLLGGSSAMGAMTYLRGNPDDYDAWRSTYGCTGWGYKDLIPYFRRAEDNEREESPYHGKGGPLPVRDLRYKSEQPQRFIEAALRRGAAANDDFNGPKQEGVGFYQVTQRDGARCSTADAYLAKKRKNLTVITEALAVSLVFDRGRAAGVTYLRGGREEIARAEAEVILAAGAIGTPQLLMLSGIGPADHLRTHGIYALADFPAVGANLMDAPAVPVLWSTPKVKGLWESTRNRDFARWRLTHSGPLTSNVAEAGGFARSDQHLGTPDLQWQVMPVAFRGQGLAERASRAMTALVTLADVSSRGRLMLASRDPRHRPRLDPGYLADVRDLNALMAGIKTMRDYAAAAPLAKIIDAELKPGDAVTSDQDLRAYIRHSVVTGYQPAGTCAMGGDVGKSASGFDAVVDPLLRVRGVPGLRIVDASVLPTLPRGGINATVIAIAERAADLIAGRAPLEPEDPSALPPAPGASGAPGTSAPRPSSPSSAPGASPATLAAPAPPTPSAPPASSAELPPWT